MAITDDRQLYELMKSMRAHGWVRDLPEDSPIYEKRADDFYEAYRFILPGYNVRPLELSGAIGVEQLKKLPVMTAARRKNWALFQELLVATTVSLFSATMEKARLFASPSFSIRMLICHGRKSCRL